MGQIEEGQITEEGHFSLWRTRFKRVPHGKVRPGVEGRSPWLKVRILKWTFRSLSEWKNPKTSGVRKPHMKTINKKKKPKKNYAKERKKIKTYMLGGKLKEDTNQDRNLLNGFTGMLLKRN